MPFSGRHTYRATLNRTELSVIAGELATQLAADRAGDSLVGLTEQIINKVKQIGSERHLDLEYARAESGRFTDNTLRTVAFHGLQIALDLEGFRLYDILDNGAACPLATGSRGGLSHVRRWEDPNATIDSIATDLSRPPRQVQTALCEYNKYVKWFAGVDAVRRRALL